MGRTVTALEIQKHNQERVSVYLDGEFAFGLPILEAARLRKGQVLSEEEITALSDIDEVSRAFDRAVKLLARRPYSTTEIRQHLGRNKTPEPVIDRVLSKLEVLGYVDDRAFAQYWIENRERFRPRGLRALRYELRQKGVAQNIIESLLADFAPRDSAYRAAQDKVRRLRGLSQREFRTKLGAFLTRRGFQYDIVREVIDTLIVELENEQPGFFASTLTGEYEE